MHALHSSFACEPSGWMTLAFSFLFFTDVNLVPPNQIQHARSHPALHVQLGTCLHRPQYLGFLVHRHLAWVDRALEHYQHMATQTKPKCPSCTCTCSCPVVFDTLSGWNTKITIHIFTLMIFDHQKHYGALGPPHCRSLINPKNEPGSEKSPILKSYKHKIMTI